MAENKPRAHTDATMQADQSSIDARGIPPLHEMRPENPQYRILPDVTLSKSIEEIQSCDYKTNHRYLGKALIISNEDFTDRRRRTRYGSHGDSKEMAQCLQKMGFYPIRTRGREYRVEDFSCYIYKNQTTKQIVQLMEEAADKDLNDYTEYDCFLCIIMSYGIENAIYCPGTPEDNYIHIKDVIEPFTPEKCPSLFLKPKIFLMQMCPPYDHTIADAMPCSAEPRLTYLPRFYKLPIYADVIVQCATIPGVWGWIVNQRKGMSWYIESLKECLIEFWNKKVHGREGKSLELQNILLRVNRKMEEKMEKEDHQVSEEYGLASVRSTLIKNAYFYRKQHYP